MFTYLITFLLSYGGDCPDPGFLRYDIAYSFTRIPMFQEEYVASIFRVSLGNASVMWTGWKQSGHAVKG
jgi:hypothetical protein